MLMVTDEENVDYNEIVKYNITNLFCSDIWGTFEVF